MAEESNFWRKVAVGCTIGAFVALLSFFAWLASTMIDTREQVIEIRGDVKSLLRTRVVAEEKDAAQTERRIDDLERSGG